MTALETIKAGLFNGNGIARRLTALVILFSTLIAVLATAIQLFASYRSGLGDIHRRLDEIANTQIPAIESSVWALDQTQIDTQIDGLVKLPDIQAITVQAGGQTIATAGDPFRPGEIIERFELRHAYRGDVLPIGQIEIIVTLDNLYMNLVDQFLTILVTNTTKTLLVAVFMLVLFQWMVTRHLYDMSAFARRIDPTKGTADEISLLRGPESNRTTDALDVLASTLNSLNRRIATSYAAIKQSEQDYQQLFVNSPIGLFRCSPEGKFVNVNPALSELMGDASPEATLRRVTDVGAGAFAAADDYRALCSTLAESGALTSESRWRRADGTEIWVAVNARAMRDADGKLFRIDGSVQDIGYRIAAEARLREARDAALAASQAKSQFLANMSHELRTPLNAVIGYSEALELGVTGELSDTQRDYAHNILTAGRHLQSMVDDLLDLGRIEAGKATLDRQPCRIDEIVDECILELAMLAEHKRIVVAVDVPPIVAPVDRRAFGQIVRNLLSNAIKFNQPDGSVSVAVRVHDDWLRLTVRDTGVGISEDTMATLFEPFQRGAAEVSRPGQGTGLGLAITRHLIELSEGEISVQSSVGKGTTIEVVLPVAAT